VNSIAHNNLGEPTVTKHLEFGVLKYFPEHNLLNFEFLIDTVFTVEYARQIFNTANEITNNSKYYFYFIMYKKISFPNDVYDFGSSQERANVILKEAYLINNVALKLIGNFYLRVKKPLIKTKIFEDEKALIDWLKKG
jgi:hypothetical protein